MSATVRKQNRWLRRGVRGGVFALVLSGFGILFLSLTDGWVDWLGAAVLGAEIAGADGEAVDADALTIAAFPEIPGVTQEYVDAFKLFLKAKQRADPKAGYRQCAAAFAAILKTTANPEIRIRSAYFLAFCHFLRRDFGKSYQYCTVVLSLSENLYRDNRQATLARRLASQAWAGELRLRDLQTVLAAQAARDTSLFVGDLDAWRAATRGLPGGKKGD